MIKLYPKELKEKFISSMTHSFNFEYQDGNPFFIWLYHTPYLIFLKNLSPAYFKSSPDITRIQLPHMDIFNKAIVENTTLIALGYDSENDVYVSWSPGKLRQRINTRNNVSLYARKSVQQTASGGGFQISTLNSGEAFVAFSSSQLPIFFEILKDLFPKDNTKTDLFEQDEVSQEIIEEISDPAVISKILPLLQKSNILEAAAVCHDQYSSKFLNMKLKDWLAVAKNMYTKLIDQKL